MAASIKAWRPAGVGHVVAIGDRSPSGGGDLPRHRGRHAGVGSDAVHGAAQVVDDDAGTPVGQQERIGPADARPAPVTIATLPSKL